MDSHTQKVFSMGLGGDRAMVHLDFIEVTEKRGSRHGLHVYVEFIKGARFSVKGYDEPCPVYDTRDRTCRHLNFFQYRCYVHAKVPRVLHGVEGLLRVPPGAAVGDPAYGKRRFLAAVRTYFLSSGQSKGGASAPPAFSCNTPGRSCNPRSRTE